MRILVLGGTRFLGRAFVEAALGRGHAVTLFNRGHTHPELFAGVERFRGDRDGGLAALAGREWDAVMDPSGYVPRVVAEAARALAPCAGRYLFVSSVSAYAEPLLAGADENAPLAVLKDAETEEIGGESYGGMKALCEAHVLEAFGARAAVVRPGLIVGPHDTTDRFPYWVRRLAAGGDVLAPGEPSAPVQLIDVRDLAGWMVGLLERGVAGTFNAVGPELPLTLGECLARMASALGSRAHLVWVTEGFLRAQGVQPWVEMPLWLHATDSGFAQIRNDRAIGAGLRFRPLEETARDTLAWERTLPPDARAGSPALRPAREADLLAQWAARK